MDDDQGDIAQVGAVLGAAGIRPSEEELATLARLLPGLRRQVDAFYAVDSGDVAPVSVFRPERAEHG